MTDATYVRQLLDTLLPRVDSLGLNEQELETSYRALGGRSLTTSQLSSKLPDIDSVVQVLMLIMSEYNNNGGLTRIHFHSLAFHVIATRYYHNQTY
jgi:ADP-dependent glucokinase